LALGAHKSLLSRLHARLRLNAVGEDDSAAYLRHRLALAGCEKELFARDAIALLHEASGGTHRDQGRLAGLALRDAARRKKKLVECELVRELLDRHARA